MTAPWHSWVTKAVVVGESNFFTSTRGTVKLQVCWQGPRLDPLLLQFPQAVADFRQEAAEHVRQFENSAWTRHLVATRVLRSASPNT